MPNIERRRMQPISFIKDVEPDVRVMDLVIGQQQIAEMEDWSDINAEELANDVKQLICESDPEYRKYFNSQPLDAQKITYEYDMYPAPIQGPELGIHVLVCFSENWSKDWGGEVIAYEECEPSEVLASDPGRICIITNNAWYKVSQPNVRAGEQLNYLFFRLV